MGLTIQRVSTDGTALLRLEGRLEGRCVDRLRRATDAALAEGVLLIVDLAGVGFVDGAGDAALEALRARGVVLVGRDDRVQRSIARGQSC